MGLLDRRDSVGIPWTLSMFGRFNHCGPSSHAGLCDRQHMPNSILRGRERSMSAAKPHFLRLNSDGEAGSDEVEDHHFDMLEQPIPQMNMIKQATGGKASNDGTATDTNNGNQRQTLPLSSKGRYYKLPNGISTYGQVASCQRKSHVTETSQWKPYYRQHTLGGYCIPDHFPKTSLLGAAPWPRTHPPICSMIHTPFSTMHGYSTSPLFANYGTGIIGCWQNQCVNYGYSRPPFPANGYRAHYPPSLSQVHHQVNASNSKRRKHTRGKKKHKKFKPGNGCQKVLPDSNCLQALECEGNFHVDEVAIISVESDTDSLINSCDNVNSVVSSLENLTISSDSVINHQNNLERPSSDASLSMATVNPQYDDSMEINLGDSFAPNSDCADGHEACEPKLGTIVATCLREEDAKFEEQPSVDFEILAQQKRKLQPSRKQLHRHGLQRESIQNVHVSSVDSNEIMNMPIFSVDSTVSSQCSSDILSDEYINSSPQIPASTFVLDVTNALPKLQLTPKCGSPPTKLSFVVSATELESDDSDSDWDDVDSSEAKDQSWSELEEEFNSFHPLKLHVSIHTIVSGEESTSVQSNDMLSLSACSVDLHTTNIFSHSTVTDKVKEANANWSSFYSDSCPSCKVSTPTKVRFGAVKPIIETTEVVSWAAEYAAARQGPWQMYAQDRLRFQRRVQHIEGTVGHHFTPKHRQLVWQNRHPNR